MPKCPVCLAAYIAIGTGLDLSVATVQILRLALLTFCALLLLLVAVRHSRRLLVSLRAGTQ